jgi:hypothetical protein
MKLFTRKRKKLATPTTDSVAFDLYGGMSIDDALRTVAGSHQPAKKRHKSLPPVMLQEELFLWLREALESLEESRTMIRETMSACDALQSSLEDIDTLLSIPPVAKAEATEAARQIVTLSEVIAKKQVGPTPDEARFAGVRRYEALFPREVVELEKKEKYHLLVKGDLNHIEGERAAIRHSRKTAERKHAFLLRFAMSAIVMLAFLFAGCLLLGNMYDIAVTVPFFLTGLLALFALAYVYMGLRQADYNMKLADAKMNRLIQIANKVKIKFVNSASVISFIYEKYNVNSAAALRRLWEQYVKAVDEVKHQDRNANLVDASRARLAESLEANGIRDTLAFVYRPETLLDPKVAAQVRHDISERLEKLHGRLEEQREQMMSVKSDILKARSDYPQYESDFERVIRTAVSE